MQGCRFEESILQIDVINGIYRSGAAIDALKNSQQHQNILIARCALRSRRWSNVMIVDLGQQNPSLYRHIGLKLDDHNATTPRLDHCFAFPPAFSNPASSCMETKG